VNAYLLPPELCDEEPELWEDEDEPELELPEELDLLPEL
jgi:hypothetical protein